MSFGFGRGRGLGGLLALVLVVALGGESRAEPETVPPPRPARDTPEASRPGDSFPIRFEGNRSLSDTSLRRAAVDELVDFETKGHRRSDADDAAFAMEVAYRGEGFAFATVEYRFGSPAGITFVVDEGPQVLLGPPRISGNDAFTTEELRRFFEGNRSGLFGGGRLRFVKSQVSSAVSQIRDLYYQSGYLDVVVEDPSITYSEDRTLATVSFAIREGTRFTVSEVAANHELSAEGQEALEAVSRELVGKPYFPRRKLAVRTRVEEAYGQLGYPEATVRVERKEGDEPGDVRLEVSVESGPRVTIAGVVVGGNEKTRESFVRNRLEFEVGDRYDVRDERRSFRNLFRSGLFSTVDLDLEETEDPDKRIAVVTVSEAPSREVFMEPGWGSYEQLRLRVGFRERNLFGTGRIFRSEAGASLKSLDALVGVTDPWFLNTDVTADFPVTYGKREEPSFTREEIAFSPTFNRSFTESLVATLGYTYRITDLSEVDVDKDLEGLDNNYNFASVKLQWTLDTRNDYFFPTEGQRSLIAGEVAESVLGSDVTFLRFTGGTRWFFSLSSSTVFGFRYDTGIVIPTGDQVTLPLGERFFLGGENTVRSYKESQLGPQDEGGDPVGGYAYNVVTVELRQRFYESFAATLFWDLGNVSPNESRDERGDDRYEDRRDVISDTRKEYFRDFRSGVGVGLQYLLPVGPVRLDLAFNPDRDPDRDERRYALHFSVGMAF